MEANATKEAVSNVIVYFMLIETQMVVSLVPVHYNLMCPCSYAHSSMHIYIYSTAKTTWLKSPQVKLTAVSEFIEKVIKRNRRYSYRQSNSFTILLQTHQRCLCAANIAIPVPIIPSAGYCLVLK